MTIMLRSLQQVSRLVFQPSAIGVKLSQTTGFSTNTKLPCGIVQCARTLCTGYEPYPKYETPSPYKKKMPWRYGYRQKLYEGGPLPRPEGELENKPLKIPPWHTQKKDNWSAKRALFGQNDYIDILGDGTIQPWQLMTGPLYLRGFRGDELQRLIRLLKFQGQKIKDLYPSKYQDIRKRVWFLYKRANHGRKRHAPFWGGRRRYSRIDKPRIYF